MQGPFVTAAAALRALLTEGQADVTRDFFGRLLQPGGVSNSTCHALPAPRFDEAPFMFEERKSLRLRIALAQ